MTDNSDRGISPGRLDDARPSRAGDILDEIDEAVAGITQAEIEDSLREILRQAGYDMRRPAGTAPGTTAMLIPAPAGDDGTPRGGRTRGIDGRQHAGLSRTARRSAGRRRVLVAACAVAVVAIMGVIAYPGYLPGPFRRAAHVGTSSPSGQAARSVHASRPASGPGGLADGDSATPAASPTSIPTTNSSAAGQPGSIAKLCQAYFSDPMRNMSDLPKLSKAAGGPMNVLKYCQPYLGDGQFHWPSGSAPGSASANPAPSS